MEAEMQFGALHLKLRFSRIMEITVTLDKILQKLNNKFAINSQVDMLPLYTKKHTTKGKMQKSLVPQ